MTFQKIAFYTIVIAYILSFAIVVLVGAAHWMFGIPWDGFRLP